MGKGGGREGERKVGGEVEISLFVECTKIHFRERICEGFMYHEI